MIEMESITKAIRGKMRETTQAARDICADLDAIIKEVATKPDTYTYNLNELRKTNAFMQKEYTAFLTSLALLHKLMKSHLEERP